MDHIAIMKPEWRLIPKILSGEKSIESRWYLTRRAPWNRIVKGDVIYFKDAGKSITAKARVEKVEQHELDPEKVKLISSEYSSRIGVRKEDLVKRNTTKRYCVLIFLVNPTTVTPFEIDKSGFGNAAAWLCVKNITSVRHNTLT
jgi:hypothetical protein